MLRPAALVAIWVAICGMVALPSLAQASETVVEDIVYVFDGGSIRTIRGTITAENDHSVTIRTADDRTLDLSRKEIAKIVRGQKSSAGGSTPESPLMSERPNLIERTGGYEGSLHNSATPSYERKNPTVALLLSILVTGGGQLYNGEYKKGVLQLGTAIAGMVTFASFYPIDSTDYIDGRYGSVETGNAAVSYAGLAVGLSAVVWSLVDAPMSANRLNQTHGWAAAPAEPEGPRMSFVSKSMSGEPTPGLLLDWSF